MIDVFYVVYLECQMVDIEVLKWDEVLGIFDGFDYEVIIGLLNEVKQKFFDVCLVIFGQVFCMDGVMFVVLIFILLYFKCWFEVKGVV